MGINCDKPHLWKADVAASVDQLNRWYMDAAPRAFRDSRRRATSLVEAGLSHGGNLAEIGPALRGYSDVGYLGYEAAESIDWVWEQRISDLDFLGV